jgi:hypothetical protein
LRERAWRPTSIKRWTPAQITLLQPAGNEKRDQSWPAKGRSEGFARLNGGFFNAIDPEQTSRRGRRLIDQPACEKGQPAILHDENLRSELGNTC